MSALRQWRRQFSWRMLLVRIIVNALSLILTAVLVPGIYFVDRSLLALFALSVGLGVLNAVVRPIIQIATLRFIFATFGIVVALINGIILLLLSVLFPGQFAVDRLIWALVGGAVLWFVSSALESLLGLSPPIVSDESPELRRWIAERAADNVGINVAGAGVTSAGDAPTAADTKNEDRT